MGGTEPLHERGQVIFEIVMAQQVRRILDIHAEMQEKAGAILEDGGQCRCSWIEVGL